MKFTAIHSLPLLAHAALIVVSAALLQACSSGSDGGGSEREVLATQANSGSGGFVYEGPPPASDEIQNFKVSFYDPLVDNNRCGECHTPGKTGTPAFVDQGNVNDAWQHARSVVNLNDPASSPVVTRVANGHNCWLAPTQASTCAATIVGYIERWADSADDSVATVNLTPRRAYQPSASVVLPPTNSDVLALGMDLQAPGELLELMTRYCSDCHSDTSPIPQVPYLASSDTDVAYAALRGKVDLTQPARSRLVQRMSPESHNCWSDCDSNAQTLQSAIAALASVVPATEVNASLLTSTAQVLGEDGVEADSGGRFENDLIAKWEFREGTGTTTADTSGVQPEIPLSLSGEYSWLAGWGIRLVNGKAQGGASASSKLFDRISGSGEYSLEAWVAPANVTQENAWIVGYAGGPDNRNLLLSQNLYNYLAFTRSSVTDDNNGGEPPLSTDDDAQLAQATLQHVVMTFDPVEGRKIYVNGVYSDVVDAAGGGLLNSWNESFAVVLGNTTAGTTPWAGAMRMVAVHNRALTPAQIEQNYDAGVGQKYFVMFSVSEIIDREGVCHSAGNQDGAGRTNFCYVVFEVSQFDESAYLFERPFFVNINPDGGNVEFDVSGIHLGINGKLAQIGQAFVNVQSSVSSEVANVAHTLAKLGTVIPLENGADQDVFFLAFDDAGGQAGSIDALPRLPFSQSLTGLDSPDIGVRTFDEINASLSALTGVPTGSTSVSPVTGKTVGETYAQVRRALPGIADFNAFSSSHLMAATQLTAAYCDALMQDNSLRATLFPGFDFSRAVANPDIDWRGQVVVPLVDRAINSGLQPAQVRDAIIAEIELLITDSQDLKPYINQNGNWVSDPSAAAHNKRDGLIYCENGASCPSTRTADVVKAACTAVFGSAVVLLQ